MAWNYTNKGLNRWRPVGAALVALGVLMSIFGVWHFIWNREVVELYTDGPSPARYRALALPAAFGLTVLIGGVAVLLKARHR